MLRGKATDKVVQRGHESLSTFGIGADVSEAQWRVVLRQLIALGYVRTEGEYNTLELTASARDVLRGEVQMLLRQQSDAPPRAAKAGRMTRTARGANAGGTGGRERPPPLPLDDDGLARFTALKAWRSEVASEHNLPAYVVFHDATLAEMAKVQPDSMDALAQISGVGAKKLEAYGREILRVLGSG